MDVQNAIGFRICLQVSFHHIHLSGKIEKCWGLACITKEIQNMAQKGNKLLDFVYNLFRLPFGGDI